MAMEKTVVIVAVARLNLIAKSVSVDIKTKPTSRQFAYVSRETIITTKKSASMIRALTVAVLNKLSPRTPRKIRNNSTCTLRII